MGLIDWDKIPPPPEPVTREEIYLANVCKSLLALLQYYQESNQNSNGEE